MKMASSTNVSNFTQQQGNLIQLQHTFSNTQTDANIPPSLTV